VHHHLVVGTGSDRVTQGEVSGERQHEWRLARGLAFEGRGLDVFAIKQTDLEVLGHVTGHRDFVGAGAMGEQAAFFVPNALFHGEPTHALHISAFNLALVHRRVDAAAHVVHDVHRFEPPLAGAGVDLHLGHRRAIAEVIKRLTLQGLKIVFDFGRHVKTGDAQTHAVEPRLLGHLFPGH
jgi:hypothetical protein